MCNRRFKRTWIGDSGSFATSNLIKHFKNVHKDIDYKNMGKKVTETSSKQKPGSTGHTGADKKNTSTESRHDRNKQESGSRTKTKDSTSSSRRSDSTGRTRTDKKNTPTESLTVRSKQTDSASHRSEKRSSVDRNKEADRTRSNLTTKTNGSKNRESHDKVKDQESIKSVARSHCSVNVNVTLEQSSSLSAETCELDKESVTELPINSESPNR